MSQDLRQLPEGNLMRELFERSQPQLPPEQQVANMAEKVAAEKRRLAGNLESVGTGR